MTDADNPYRSPGAKLQAADAPVSPDILVRRGRVAFLGIVAFLLLLTVLPCFFGAEVSLVRLAWTSCFLLAAWRGHGWAITLLAIGFALGALYLVCYELPHAIVARLPQAVVLTALFAAAYVGIPLVMVRSRSLNAFFKHQEQQRHGETFVAPGTENRRNVVTLTPAAAELARKIVSERGFPPGTALRIVRHKDGDRRIDVQYDVPADDDRDWIGESLSIVVLIDKTIASELEGLTIDAANGQYVFLFQ